MKAFFTQVCGFFGRIGKGLARCIPTRRRLIQLYAALLFNANLKGYINGQIYQGPLKMLCTPGLNCYSCPGAATACPMGSLQNALSVSNKKAPYFLLGILLLYGVILGRWICGFLCPFGLVQDLLYKIRTPKLKKNRFTRLFSWFKYVILAVFVVIIPMMYALRDLPLPAFCKYICPAGTLGGALGLLSNSVNEELFGMLGPLFTWKFILMVCFLVGAVFIYRVFCRFFCPLGAIYGLFNRFALLGMTVKRDKCVDCGRCVGKCKMDIRHVGDHECISCGDCIEVCPTGAIVRRGGKFVLAENEIPAKDATEDEIARIEKDNARRTRGATLRRRILAAVMAVVLLGALVYYNLIDKAPSAEPPTGEETETGYEVGDICPSAALTVIGGEGSFSLDDNRGKITVINFWHTACTPCVQELPHFDAVASEYADSVTVVAVHNYMLRATAPDFISLYYPSSEILFVEDGEGDAYFKALGGLAAWPMTLIVDGEGRVAFRIVGSVTHEELTAVIDSLLGTP